MIRLLYVGLFIASVHALAKERPNATVWTSGTVRSVKALFHPRANVRVLSSEEQDRRNRKSGYFPPHERDAIFRKVGIETKVSSMDEFDKDMLMINARVYSVRELKAEYPRLTETQLARLKSEVGKRK